MNLFSQLVAEPTYEEVYPGAVLMRGLALAQDAKPPRYRRLPVCPGHSHAPAAHRVGFLQATQVPVKRKEFLVLIQKANALWIESDRQQAAPG